MHPAAIMDKFSFAVGGCALPTETEPSRVGPETLGRTLPVEALKKISSPGRAPGNVQQNPDYVVGDCFKTHAWGWVCVKQVTSQKVVISWKQPDGTEAVKNVHKDTLGRQIIDGTGKSKN